MAREHPHMSRKGTLAKTTSLAEFLDVMLEAFLVDIDWGSKCLASSFRRLLFSCNCNTVCHFSSC